MTEPAFVHPLCKVLEAPVIAAAPMQFRSAYLNDIMSRQIAQIGAGWFLGRMCYLLGEGLERLAPCVRAWSFLLPPSLNDWVIIGFNAYGQILLLDQAGEKGTMSPVGMLDPLTISYVSPPELDVISLLGHWLPEQRLPGFLDASVYAQFLSTSQRLLDDDEILGIQQALPLGGDMVLENFDPIDIVDYYEAVGPVYAEAYAELGVRR